MFIRPIPIPIRKRILELYERGKSTREIAQFSGFCVAAVRRVRQRFRERRTHDDERHGATWLFAALEMATGKVIAGIVPGSCASFWTRSTPPRPLNWMGT